jgi:hypothetical protein
MLVEAQNQITPAAKEFRYRGMADETEEKQQPRSNPDEIALELMKFVAITTGYGKGTPTTGFSGKGPRSTEEYADSLIELFERCRAVVRKEPAKA